MTSPLPQSRNPYLFVVGMPQVGHDTAAAHARCSSPTGGRQRHTLHPARYSEGPVRLRRKWACRRTNQAHTRADRSGSQLPPISAPGPRRIDRWQGLPGLIHLSRICRQVVSRVRPLEREVPGGEKTPDYVRHLPLLHALFPWVRSVHIIRDGRDVALSALEWAREGKGPGRMALWREEPVAVCALWWRWQVRTGRQDAESLRPGSYLEVRYENLVEGPEETLRSITDFLQLPLPEKKCWGSIKGKFVMRRGFR